tara:strand:- start:6 stop:1304 length:1299 start_codon:yes stop_codon:yes gene_type:complete
MTFFIKKLKNILGNFNGSSFGFFSFNTGIFFLFSAPAIAVIFIVLSLICAYFQVKENPFNDWINKSFFVVIVFMVASCIFFKLFNQEIAFKENFLEYTHPFIGLFNWLPLFFSFWGFQYYLKTKEHRKIVGISIICSTVPVLISGIGQYYLNLYGPYNFLNGLIIWYQRDNHNELTSLFNNQNYAGCILATTWPFFFASIFNPKINLNLRFLAIFFNFVVVLEILLTNSRNAFLGLIVGILILLIPLKPKNIFLVLVSFLSTLILGMFSKNLLGLYSTVFNIFSKFNYQNFANDPRIIIWENSFKYIFKKPLLGWGGNSFSSIWNYENDVMYLHSHSAPLELTIQYGISPFLILTFIFVFLVIKSFRKIFFENKNKLITFSKDNQFDRAWLVGTIIILLSNTVDILYFDLRVSILMWILLAGLRNVIKEKLA